MVEATPFYKSSVYTPLILSDVKATFFTQRPLIPERKRKGQELLVLLKTVRDGNRISADGKSVEETTKCATL